MKKQVLILSSELLAYILIGIFIGYFLDDHFHLKGWGTLSCLALLYLLWFLKLYKILSQKEENPN